MSKLLFKCHKLDNLDKKNKTYFFMRSRKTNNNLSQPLSISKLFSLYEINNNNNNVTVLQQKNLYQLVDIIKKKNTLNTYRSMII